MVFFCLFCLLVCSYLFLASYSLPNLSELLSSICRTDSQLQSAFLLFQTPGTGNGNLNCWTFSPLPSYQVLPILFTYLAEICLIKLSACSWPSSKLSPASLPSLPSLAFDTDSNLHLDAVFSVGSCDMVLLLLFSPLSFCYFLFPTTSCAFTSICLLFPTLTPPTPSLTFSYFTKFLKSELLKVMSA